MPATLPTTTLLMRVVQKFEVDCDIAEYQDDNSVATPLGYGKVPTPKINVLKHLLRTIQRMLQSAGSAEVLRLLPEPDSSFIPTLKSILDHRSLFGSTILAAGMNSLPGLYLKYFIDPFHSNFGHCHLGA